MWCGTHGILDPCGADEGWELIITAYIKDVMTGVNYNNKSVVRSATCQGYAAAVNHLFTLRDFPAPCKFDDKENMIATIIHNLEREEDIATQRSPLTSEIFAELKRMADATPEDSPENAVFNIVCFGRITGPRASEYAQKTQTKVEQHKYPSGKEVIKAFVSDDFEFYDKKGRRIRTRTAKSLSRVHHMRARWRIQKNRQNGQGLKIMADLANPEICPVRNAFLLVLRKTRLEHSLELPLAIFVNKTGAIKYLTASKIADVIRAAARTVHPDLTEEEIKKFSAHSIRVWACVLLSEAGKDPDFIKSRLRWMGESYRTYLRDTDKITTQHLDALEAATAEVMKLLAGNLDELQLPDDTPEDNDMGEYEDIIN